MAVKKRKKSYVTLQVPEAKIPEQPSRMLAKVLN
jgi:hypothetical protein